WMFLLAASLSLLDLLHTTFINNPQGHGMLSKTWAGYIVASDLEKPHEQIVGINASWTVPRIGVFWSDAYSSAWIGIGGQFDKTLIQAGTEHDSINGQEYYSAWYELLPDKAVRITDMRISAGDLIIASINLVNSSTNEWAISINDVTKGEVFCQTFIYNSSRLSAEWIVERPIVNDEVSSLTNFGTLTFRDAYVKMGENFGKIGSFPYSQVIMTNDLSLQLASVSALNADGSSFNVTYLNSG
ncbi:MAG: G1 family endopeptidase, partial [Candidatus Bathyarchaeota archaeon]|nr:G1 family endopeptidase [Candidatus Bathyarchaeota archaeon]